MKTRRIPLLIGALAAVGLLLGGGDLLARRANPNHGKAVFKATCKLCHTKGGEAKVLTPMTKTIAQWERYFKDEAAVQACVVRAEEKSGDDLAAPDLEDMEFFLVSHAADSDQPETCGE